MPFFTIITIVFNTGDSVEKTINSLINQSFEDYEFVVIDGGSTDNTLAVLDCYSDRINVLVSEPDSGIYDAMNKGVDRSSGEYLIFMNSGDCFFDSFVLSNLEKFIKGSGFPDLVYGDSSECLDGRLWVKPARSHKKAWYGMFTHHQSMLYKRASLGGLRYNLSFPIGADYDFTLNFLKISKNVLYFPFTISVFEGGGVSSRRVRQSAVDLYRIRRLSLGFSALESLSVLFLGVSVLAVRKLVPVLYHLIRFR